MIRSMTGFAQKDFTLKTSGNKELHIAVQLKSLNSRFFELTCKIPSAFSALEVKLHKLLKSKLLRGHAFLSVKLQSHTLATHVHAKKETIAHYLKTIHDVQNEFSLPGHVTIQDILHLPHIFDITEDALETNVYEKVMHAIEKTADLLLEDQLREGASLQKDLKKRGNFLATTITDLKIIADAAKTQRQEKLTVIRQELEHIEESDEAYDGLKTKKDILLVEIEKTNITEEIVRFKTHLQSLLETLESQANTRGKRLDFITQELHREINTTSAKINNAQVSNLVVHIKAELEKIKEQIQNIV